MRTLSVVGAGVIGLSVAWRAAEAGWQVTLHDPTPGRGASWVAGGMLAPLTEGLPGEDAALDLGARSLERWPAFASDLAAASAMPSGLQPDGTLAVGVDQADLDQLSMLAGWLADRGRSVTTVDRRALRAREPLLSNTIRGGLDVPGDLAVDNRVLLAALLQACTTAGVAFDRDPVATTADLPADQVVVAAGAWSAALAPQAKVRPVKGEILRLRRRPGALPAPTCTVRALIHGRHVYVVPRANGVVVGATQLEAGFDDEVTLGGVRDLIADAEAVMPGLAEYGLIEASAGLRPMTPDGLPLIGRIDARTVLATGHGRNGILLAPITADAVLAELEGVRIADLDCADPGRFR